jgi:hypothetical protein
MVDQGTIEGDVLLCLHLTPFTQSCSEDKSQNAKKIDPIISPTFAIQGFK